MTKRSTTAAPKAQMEKPKTVGFAIPGRVASKKNGKEIAFNRSTGRRFIRSSDKFKAWEISAKAELMAQKKELERQYGTMMFPLTGKLRLTIRFEMHGLRHEPDLSNLIEGPQDIMQELGIIENDKQITEIDAIKVMDQVDDFCTIRIGPAYEGV